MGTIDLRDSADVSHGRPHYVIQVGGTSLVYAYIRKNGCSAFKSFFVTESTYERQPGQSDIQFMARHHQAGESDIRTADHRICVLREPVSRVVSVFRNKFIQQSGNGDIFSSYERVTGRSPHDCTFEAFVGDYLSLPLDDLDPHLYSQTSHLLPIRYDQAWLLDDLASAMSALVGPELAQKHFTKRLNATSTRAQSDASAAGLTAAELHRQYTSSGELPSTKALCTPELRERIHDRYAADCRLLEKYSPAA